eukprot:gene7689-7518_t
MVRRLTDEIVYAAGDPPNGIFALISGEIRVTQTTAAGRSALLMIASPGAWFGEAAMIDGQPRSSDAIAVGQAVVLQLSPPVLAQTHGLQERSGVIIDLHLSQENLAEMVGVSRQSLNRALKALEAKGMVS